MVVQGRNRAARKKKDWKMFRMSEQERKNHLQKGGKRKGGERRRGNRCLVAIRIFLYSRRQMVRDRLSGCDLPVRTKHAPVREL